MASGVWWRWGLFVLISVANALATIGDLFGLIDQYSPESTVAAKTIVIISLPVLLCVCYFSIFIVVGFLHLSKLRHALPILFRKSEHLLSSFREEALLEFREQLKRQFHDAAIPEPVEIVDAEALQNQRMKKYKELLLSSQPSTDLAKHPVFQAQTANSLLDDLSEALTEVGGSRYDVYYALYDSFAAGINQPGNSSGTIARPLVPFYSRQPTVDRIQKEFKYMQEGASVPSYVLGSKTRTMSFQTLADAGSFHQLSTWVDMGDYIQSLALTQIVVNQSPVGVLIVTNRKRNALPEELPAVLECTANMIGTVFEIASFVHDMYMETLVREKTIATMQDEIKILEKQNSDLSRKLKAIEKQHGTK